MHMRWSLVVFVSLLIAVPFAAANQPTYPEGGEEPEPSTYDDPCQEAQHRLDARLAEIDERYRQEHAKLDGQREAFYSEPRTPEEQEAFEARDREQRQALHDAQAKEHQEAHAAFQAECKEMHPDPAEGTTAPAPYPHEDAWMDEECRNALQEAEAAQRQEHERFQAELQAKWAAFEAEMRASWDAFHSEGNRSHEETQAFEDEMETKRAAFRHEMRTYEEAQHQRLEAAMQAHHAKIEAACHVEPMAGSGAAVAIPAELEALQRECDGMLIRLESAHKAEMQAQASWNGSHDAEPAHHEDLEARHAAFEEELRRVMRECEERARALWEEKMGSHIDAQPPADRMGSWHYEMVNGRIMLTGKYVSLVGDPSTNTLGRIAVAGETYIADLDTLGALEFFDMEETIDGDSTLLARGEGLRLRIHDAPAGVINLHSDKETAYLLTIPASVRVAPAANGWSLEGAGGSAFLRVADGRSEWSPTDRVMKAWGEVTFFVDSDTKNQIVPTAANKHRSDLVDAMKERRLGAEVSVTKAADGDAVDDSVIYDGEVEVKVESPKKGTADPLVITVSSHTLNEGRTFVVNVDKEVLGKHVAIAYYDVDEETGAETQVEIRKASSLTDILDASDDETAEYWIVEDEDGLQVLVSVDHWSVHRFKVESAAPPQDGFAALPGPAVMLVVVAACALMGAARRRD